VVHPFVSIVTGRDTTVRLQYVLKLRNILDRHLGSGGMDISCAAGAAGLSVVWVWRPPVLNGAALPPSAFHDIAVAAAQYMAYLMAHVGTAMPCCCQCSSTLICESSVLHCTAHCTPHHTSPHHTTPHFNTAQHITSHHCRACHLRQYQTQQSTAHDGAQHRAPAKSSTQSRNRCCC
jgi:hypothetical protein